VDTAVRIVLLLGIVTAAALALYGSLRFWIGGRSFRTLGEFRAEVERRTGLHAGPHLPRTSALHEIRFAGALPSGRRAHIFFEEHQSGKAYYHTAHFCVQADPALTLDVTREDFLARIGAWLGLTGDVHVGDAEFDKRFWIKTPNEGRTRKAMDQGLKEVVERLFQTYGIERLRIEGGWLQVVAQSGSVDPFAYATLLAWLERAAQAFDRVPIAVKVLGGERHALKDGSGGTRCAYCHGGISGAEPDLVACERCHTVLHDDCWRELGHCPLLGCAGKSPERARTT
jgi:hypothetical protein